MALHPSLSSLQSTLHSPLSTPLPITGGIYFQEFVSYFEKSDGAPKFMGFLFGLGTLLFGLLLTMPANGSSSESGGAERTQLDGKRGGALSEVTLNKHNSINGTELHQASAAVIVVDAGRGSGYSEPTQAL